MTPKLIVRPLNRRRSGREVIVDFKLDDWPLEPKLMVRWVKWKSVLLLLVVFGTMMEVTL